MTTLAELDLPHVAMDDPAFAADPLPRFEEARQKHPWLAKSTYGVVITEYTAMRDLFGRDVALAARVAGEAVGGEILVSDAVASHVDDEAGLSCVRAQEVELKGLPGVHQLWSVEVPVG